MLRDVPAQLRGCLLPARKQGPQLAPWDLLSFSPPSKVGPAFLLRRWHRLRGMNGNFLLPGPSQHDSGRLRLEKLNQRVLVGQGFPQTLITLITSSVLPLALQSFVHCGRSVCLLLPRR